ncbi:MAG: DUF2892 domain-containing protein, partial [Bacteroidota bacterium]|nr:DUF2892 domain-containing protein [Bacteroidota bacterium]
MKSNVGKTDKTVRIILGIIIAALGYYYHTWWPRDWQICCSI